MEKSFVFEVTLPFKKLSLSLRVYWKAAVIVFWFSFESFECENSIPAVNFEVTICWKLTFNFFKSSKFVKIEIELSFTYNKPKLVFEIFLFLKIKLEPTVKSLCVKDKEVKTLKGFFSFVKHQLNLEMF